MSSVSIITLIKEKNAQFDILREISENVTLVELMESFGNVNHEVSIVVYWIYDTNKKKALPLKLD